MYSCVHSLLPPEYSQISNCTCDPHTQYTSERTCRILFEFRESCYQHNVQYSTQRPAISGQTVRAPKSFRSVLHLRSFVNYGEKGVSVLRKRLEAEIEQDRIVHRSDVQKNKKFQKMTLDDDEKRSDMGRHILMPQFLIQSHMIHCRMN